MIKVKQSQLFFNNLKVRMFFKTIFLFSIGVYILSLPLLTLKLSLFDSINWIGYVSPSWVLFGENIFCIGLSIISISWSVITFRKLRSFMKNEVE